MSRDIFGCHNWGGDARGLEGVDTLQGPGQLP